MKEHMGPDIEFSVAAQIEPHAKVIHEMAEPICLGGCCI